MDLCFKFSVLWVCVILWLLGEQFGFYNKMKLNISTQAYLLKERHVNQWSAL